MKSRLLICLAGLSLIFSTTAIFGGAKIQASANPSQARIAPGNSIEIPIIIDMSELPEKLGSYTATLEWDPEVLRYEQHRGGTTLGFEHPVINATEVKKGKLRFAHAYPYGARGEVNILNVTMKVIGKESVKIPLDLSFSAMAAAYTFIDLLPYLEVQKSHLELKRERETPTRFALESHPNPFNPSTEIRYQLPQSEDVKIVIYNVLGQEILELVNGRMDAGSYVITWNGDNKQGVKAPSGMYFLRMKAGEFTAERKLLLVK